MIAIILLLFNNLFCLYIFLITLGSRDIAFDYYTSFTVTLYKIDCNLPKTHQISLTIKLYL